jgi:hypothetical protein
MRAELLSTINRVYECQMAKLELESLGAGNVEFELDKLEFTFETGSSRKRALRDRLSWFESVDGEATRIWEVIRANSSVLREHADLYFSHLAYPFKARFRPPLARSLINIVNPGDEGIILDNFSGSGTTQVEASLLGIESVGVDINPFYTFMAWAKIEFFTRRMEPESEAKRIWRELSAVSRRHGECIPDSYHPLVYVIYSFATQMRFKKPKNMFLKKYRNVKTLQEEWFRIREKFILGRVEAITCSAESLPYPDGYFTGVVTSPPYSNAIDYTKENRGAPEFFPVTEELKRLYSPTRNLKLYKQMMKKAIRETVRVVKPGHKIAYVAGNQRKNGKVVPLVDWCVGQFEANGCRLLHSTPQLISSTGTWNILMDEILIFEKTQG